MAILIVSAGMCGFTLSSKQMQDRLILARTLGIQAEARFEGDRVVSLKYPNQRQRNPIAQLRRQYMTYHFDSPLYATGAQLLYNLEPLAGPRRVYSTIVAIIPALFRNYLQSWLI